MTVILLSLTIAACKHDDASEQNVFYNAVTDVDGNKYDAVKIGNKIWMKSNLRTTHFKDGSPIPKGRKGDQTGWEESSKEGTPGHNPETNNASGFSAYPTGGYFGAFRGSGSVAAFWSSTKEVDELAWRRYLYNDNSCLVRCKPNEEDGLSVRCAHN